MLDKPVMFVFTMILFIFFTVSGLVVVSGAVKQYQFLTQSQILANTMARYGYYNSTCEDSLKEFCDRSKVKRSEVSVITNSNNPNNLKTYGQTVKVELQYDYKPTITVGSLSAPLTLPIKAPASAVSTCVPGLHVSP